jgi:hypothetical protein
MSSVKKPDSLLHGVDFGVGLAEAKAQIKRDVMEAGV